MFNHIRDHSAGILNFISPYDCEKIFKCSKLTPLHPSLWYHLKVLNIYYRYKHMSLLKGWAKIFSQSVVWEERDISWFYTHDDVIKWKHFPRYWSFVWGIHQSPENSPHNDQWRWALMFSLIYAWTNGWVNHRDAGGWRRHRAHHDVTLMFA